MWLFKKSKETLVKESLYDYYQQWGFPISPLEATPPGAQYGIASPVIEYYPWKSSVLRTVIDFDIVRQSCRRIYETNGNIKGLLHNLANYIIGEGFTIKLYSDEGENTSLVLGVESFLDDIIEKNELNEYFWQSWVDLQIDGELFLRAFPQADGLTTIRTVMPDQIRPPMNSNWEGIWSFGIQKPLWDSGGPAEKFNVYYYTYNQDWHNAPQEEVVLPNLMHHLKINTRKNTKRGISSLYAVLDENDLSKKLRYIALKSETERKKIAYFREFSLAAKQVVEQLGQDKKSRDHMPGWANDGDGKVSVVDVPKSLQVKEPPNCDLSSSIGIIQNALETVASNFQAPSFMITGQADASSYSSAVVVESQFHKSIVHQQQIISNYWRKVLRSVLEIGVAQQVIPAAALDLRMEIKCPSPLGRNKKEENESWFMLVQNKIMSQHQWAALNGLDLDAQKKIIATEDELPNMMESLEGKSNEGSNETMSGEQKSDEGAR